MTCIRFGGLHPSDPVGFVCVNEQHLLKVGKRYIWMSWHNYTGPAFYTKVNGDEIYYEPKDEADPVWREFYRWLDKKQKRKV